MWLELGRAIRTAQAVNYVGFEFCRRCMHLDFGATVVLTHPVFGGLGVMFEVCAPSLN